MYRNILASLSLAAIASSSFAQSNDEIIVLDAKMHHLGDNKTPEWTEAPAEPEGFRLDIRFKSKANPEPRCFLVRHRHVDNLWHIELNGKRIGKLKTGKELRDHRYLIPGFALEDGTNKLSFVSTKKSDDITIGNVRLYKKPFREVFNLRPVRVFVSDGQRPIPAKITVTTHDDRLAEPFFAELPTQAARNGIVYTSSGAASFELPAGSYRFHASRGTEWGLDRRDIEVQSMAPTAVELQIQREIDTTGYVACDSHIHTLTYSGHGDSSVEERLVTLAAEGVELAIATDHNHHTDYRPVQKKMDLGEHFKPVVGNEVTTKLGHFNAWPMKGKPPEHRITDWIKLIEGIRDAGAKVVVLNHPRWPKIKTGPFGKFGMNRFSGHRMGGPRRFTFDAVEIVNSTSLLEDPLFLFQDWFALLNGGEQLTVTGTSDSHTVGDPVGQGRTYVKSSTDDPAKINVNESCKSFRLGRTSVSLGIFCEVWVDGRNRMGDTVRVRDNKVDVVLRIASASWVSPQRARVFLNGGPVVERSVPTQKGQPTDVRLKFEIPTGTHDAYLVCIVTGPGISSKHWPTEANYTVAATNPVWLDVDRNGRYESPRETAMRLTRGMRLTPAKLNTVLDPLDDAVAIQVLNVAWSRVPRAEAYPRMKALVAELKPRRPVYDAWLESIEPPAQPAEAAGRKKNRKQ